MQRQIQEYIENTTTNPHFGADPLQIDFQVDGGSVLQSENENFIITSRYEHPTDNENLYYNLMFRDVSLREWRIQLTPIVSIKKGILKVAPNGEMTILNETLRTSNPPRPIVNADFLVSFLVYIGLEYRLDKFTDAKFEFVDGKLKYKDGFTVVEGPRHSL